ncbi:iron-containing alcohol dehydrogenase [Caldisericum exile]|uniref:Alcohol dehydrogenase n=1 Tax=Caldisericum exile (strain DSM 21853 / NBRC 104410 / AZM16c01) TaxID=511051 RepID=A0A7U6JGX3_CALEA|nr:iron-containing alcohol dehydrogenase [Caldisericum exile]BAL81007.1 alcohol dehydrogenase [Caldisericum exile AZM16c01]
MDNFVLHIPTKVVFGKGEFNSLGKYARELGTKALVVTGRRFAKESGLLDKALKQLDEVGIKYVVYSEIEPNPESKTVDKGGEVARNENVDFIIAIGGGSVIDAAKGIAIVAKTGNGIWDYLERPPKKRVMSDVLPILSVVTVAATGSELDGAAVITNTDTRHKRGIMSPFLYPKISIVDPLLTISIPQKQTIDGVVDMFTHILEGYLSSKVYAPVSDAISEALMKEAIHFGEIAYENPNDVNARESLSWISSLALSQIPSAGRSGPFPIHRLEHPISGLYGISHGRGLAILLPAFLYITKDIHEERLKKLGKAIFSTDSPTKTIERIVHYLKKVDAFESLKKYAVRREDLDKFAKMAFEDEGKDVILARAPLTTDVVLKIYELAYDYKDLFKNA